MVGFADLDKECSMIWLFILGIIGFCIASAGFRKLVFWACALGLGAGVIVVILATVNHWQI
jgi:hypothetical protein